LNPYQFCHWTTQLPKLSYRLALKLLRYSSSGTPCNNITVDRPIRAASGFLIFRRNSAWQTNAFIIITKRCPSPIFRRKYKPAYHSVAPSLSYHLSTEGSCGKYNYPVRVSRFSFRVFPRQISKSLIRPAFCVCSFLLSQDAFICLEQTYKAFSLPTILTRSSRVNRIDYSIEQFICVILTARMIGRTNRRAVNAVKILDISSRFFYLCSTFLFPVFLSPRPSFSDIIVFLSIGFLPHRSFS
jgi:hypothetical protein